MRSDAQTEKGVKLRASPTTLKVQSLFVVTKSSIVVCKMSVILLCCNEPAENFLKVG